MTDHLLAVYPNGTILPVHNSYESIKAAMEEATIDVVGLPDDHGLFVDDNGMLNAEELNVPASIFAQMSLYGPVVLCGPTDPEGETTTPQQYVHDGLMALAMMWRRVVLDAERKGQQIIVRANPDTVPPATVMALTEEQFEDFLNGTWSPGDE